MQWGARTERLDGTEGRARGRAHSPEPIWGPALLEARGSSRQVTITSPRSDTVAATSSARQSFSTGTLTGAPKSPPGERTLTTTLSSSSPAITPAPLARVTAAEHSNPLPSVTVRPSWTPRAGGLGKAHAVRGRQRELAGRAGRAHAVVVAAQRERLDLAELGPGRRGRRGEQRQGDQGCAHQRTLTVVRAGRPGSPIVRRVT